MVVSQAVGQGMQTVTLHEPHSRELGGRVSFIISGGSQAISGLPHTEGATRTYLLPERCSQQAQHHAVVYLCSFACDRCVLRGAAGWWHHTSMTRLQ